MDNKKLLTWSGFTSRAVQEYLPYSAPATDKVHMKIYKQGISITEEKTKTALESIEIYRDLHPPIVTEE